MGRQRTDPMSERHPFDKLTKDFTPKRRARVDSRKGELRTAVPLCELRWARSMTRKVAVEEWLRLLVENQKRERLRQPRGMLLWNPLLDKMRRNRRSSTYSVTPHQDNISHRLRVGSLVSVGAVSKRPARSLWLLQGRHTVFFFDLSAIVNPSDWRICSTLGTI